MQVMESNMLIIKNNVREIERVSNLFQEENKKMNIKSESMEKR